MSVIFSLCIILPHQNWYKSLAMKIKCFWPHMSSKAKVMMNILSIQKRPLTLKVSIKVTNLWDSLQETKTIYIIIFEEKFIPLKLKFLFHFASMNDLVLLFCIVQVLLKWFWWWWYPNIFQLYVFHLQSATVKKLGYVSTVKMYHIYEHL